MKGEAPPELAGLCAPQVGQELAEHDILYVQQCLAVAERVSFPKGSVHDALVAASRRVEVHPLREYLERLEWDREPRFDGWLSTYLGAYPNEYTRAVGRWWLIAAVARAFDPGCQADHMLVLEGKQGVGKSSAVRILAGGWYLGSLPDIRNKDAALALQGNWIVEIGELDALRGASATRVKDFVSQTVDSYRPPYDRVTIRRPRSSVFVGTTFLARDRLSCRFGRPRT